MEKNDLKFNGYLSLTEEVYTRMLTPDLGILGKIYQWRINLRYEDLNERFFYT